jgi:hypothetical protein
MSAGADCTGRPDRAEYVKNRGQVSPDDLLRYAGEWIAWSLDESHVVAHHHDLQEASRRVRQAGLGDEDVTWERIPPDGEPESLLL